MSISIALLKIETQRPHTTIARRFHQTGWLRLMIGVVGIWGINSLLVALAIEAGTAFTPVHWGLGVCADRPCFRGIVPGVTRWSEVEMIFAAMDSRRSSSATIVAHDRNSTITVYRSVDSLTVRALNVVTASDAQFALGEVIHQLGNPCSVSFYGYLNNVVVILHYPSVAVGVQASNRLTQDTPVQAITFSTANPLVDPCQTAGSGLAMPYVNRPWRGFGSIQHYLRQEP